MSTFTDLEAEFEAALRAYDAASTRYDAAAAALMDAQCKREVRRVVAFGGGRVTIIHCQLERGHDGACENLRSTLSGRLEG